VSDATAWIHRNNGLEYQTPETETRLCRTSSVDIRNSAIIPDLDPDKPSAFDIVNYSDDFAGCQSSLDKAMASFTILRNLMENLGLVESVDKACPPFTKMVFLGVLFDTVQMTMSVPAEKSKSCV
jgi:hypothetical protein